MLWLGVTSFLFGGARFKLLLAFSFARQRPGKETPGLEGRGLLDDVVTCTRKRSGRLNFVGGVFFFHRERWRAREPSSPLRACFQLLVRCSVHRRGSCVLVSDTHPSTLKNKNSNEYAYCTPTRFPPLTFYLFPLLLMNSFNLIWKK